MTFRICASSSKAAVPVKTRDATIKVKVTSRTGHELKNNFSLLSDNGFLIFIKRFYVFKIFFMCNISSKRLVP